MIGLTIMDIHPDEMRAIVEYYLNHNLLNTTFQAHHGSVVEDVRMRSNGRFVIEFRGKRKAKVVNAATTVEQAASGGD